MNDYRHIGFEVDDGVALVTIRRPEVRNALNKRAQAELADSWARIRDDREIIVGIVTAEGDRAFSSGADLRDRGANYVDDPLVRRYAPLGEPGVFPREAPVAKPLIAAINGVALGMGAVIAMQCDIRVGCEAATIGYPLIKVGIFPPRMHEMWMLGPPGLALESLLTGDPLSAADAYRVGLLNHLVEGSQVLPKAFEIARKIRANAPLVIEGIKATWDSEPVYALVRGSRVYQHHSRRIAESEDAKEGPAAFAAKRPPVWKGR
ncbi:MAG: enoyl-CoA hydratase/isomerase family protein [Dehalococcoidia bacterium]